MKILIYTTLIVLSLSFGISGFANSSVAKESKVEQYSVAKQDGLVIVRIVENGKKYICIILNGIFISKMEEL